MSIVPVVFGTDEKYVPYCAVAIQSMIDNCSSDYKYDVVVLYDVLSELALSNLSSLTTSNVIVRPYCIHEQIKDLRAIEYNHLTVASAYRLVIPNVLVEYDKAIYLDSDITVCDDIKQLYEIDIKENLLGAVHGYFDPDKNGFMYQHITKTLGIEENEFFNAGILIMNLKAIREQKIKEECFRLLRERDDLYFLDQCALNISCRGQVYFIPQKWNEEWERWMHNESLTKEQIERGNNASIIHYAGTWKAWDYPERFLANRFWEVARKTRFYEQILVESELRREKEIRSLLCINKGMKEVVVYGAGNIGQKYVQNVKQRNLFNIVAWVDKNFQEKQKEGLNVDAPDTLFEKVFDHIVVTVQNEKVASEIKNSLVEHGVEEDIILFYKA